LGPGLAGVGGCAVLDLCDLLLGLCLDVEPVLQLVDGRGELVALTGDVRLDGLGGRPVGAHAEVPPLIVATSSSTPAIAFSGAAGVAWPTCFLPMSAATPAIANSTAVTISAADHSGSTRSRSTMQVVSNAARP